MRGEIISGEYNKMIFISDENGKELDDNQKKRCLDTSLVPGDTW
jgi:hypothetical protein